MNMIEKITELTCKLIQLNTDPKNKKELWVALEIVKSELKEFEYKEFYVDWVSSILFYNHYPKSGIFSLLLNSHLDIIPAKQNQFIPIIEGNRIYWAWALDMKWWLASALHAFKFNAKNSAIPMGFQIVTDEETWGYKWTKHQIESWVLSDFVISTEPTNLDIVHKAKWVLQFEVVILWLTTHSAYPWRWSNAIFLMMHFLQKFTQVYVNPEKDSWKTTYNFSEIISTQYGYNKVPDECRVKIDIRYTDKNFEKLENKIRSLLPKNSVMNIYAKEPCFYTNPSSPEIKNIAKIIQQYTQRIPKIYGAHGTSDARHFLKNAIEFWPEWGDIWWDQEFVEIKSLQIYYEILSQIINNRNM